MWDGAVVVLPPMVFLVHVPHNCLVRKDPRGKQPLMVDVQAILATEGAVE